MTETQETPYQNPLIERYASREMAFHWGPQRRFASWRKVWIALAEAEQELGIAITDAQIEQLKSFENNLNLDAAAKYERELRHDVMAHVHAYGDQCPDARGIIHLGATSCFVTDNADLLLIREALELTAKRLAATIDQMAKFAAEHRDLPCLAFTHFQPAQPTTVGKRACLWIYDLVLDLEAIEHRLETLRARSAKGTTGTQASFLELFSGDQDKVRTLEKRIAEKLSFDSVYAVTGQTYPRKVDAQLLDALSGIGQSLHKIATDIRLLAGRKEVEEPFEKKQIGSSAMAYKRNPMRSERICALGRFVMSLQSSPAMTAATQWMERTLDDSANRRLVIPQAFLAIDAALVLMQNVADGMVVYPATIAKNLGAELPFMATENILMQAVAAGGDRQDLHEQIRVHSQAAALEVKQNAGDNDLLERLKGDENFAGIDLEAAIDPHAYVGRAPQQVDEFMEAIIAPIRQRYSGGDSLSVEVTV
ncbi:MULTISPECIES: adenylosuccinate lyase [Rhodopirellula]|uniref:Adenylosuccinate lyase n=1 Tax=Rhodopirellula europaea SH398 TaxID=1263868 RepID=M5S7N9_9BACT|nr:adenylosuccinate lyase [Rhodopirellula europaea]EMI27658.1 adenylosuccinate lyase [Rhodopirellula europaea SH398]MCR9211329.1 adenylosuccinate lyase [bacterium]|tara:strand:- start:28130 stop:29566 length:1437 start_codon:yes stop_codon:yes gene_type:complete